jgi:Na+/melibiose symporter-like transporter
MIALKSGKFRIRLLVTMLNWLGNTFAYDGLSFNIGALGGNPYLNYIYSAVVELGGLIASHIALEKLGRKRPYCICLVLAGLSLVSISFVPSRKSQEFSIIDYTLIIINDFV